MFSIHTILEACFWTAAALVLYTYAAYPLFIWQFARAFGRSKPPEETATTDKLPTVAVLIAAYNEEAVIAQRIRNALELQYPDDKLQVVVASDGSSDRTVPIARGFRVPRVQILDNPFRRGKMAVLNAAID